MMHGSLRFTVNNHPIQRAEPEDKVVIINHKFQTNEHYVLFSNLIGPCCY